MNIAVFITEPFCQIDDTLMRTHFTRSVIATEAWQSRRRRNRCSIQRDRDVATLLAMTNWVRVRAEIRYDPVPDLAERKADYHHVRTKKKGSKRRQHAQAQAARRSHQRIQRRRSTKRQQVKQILRDAGPKAVAVESLRLPNMLASAAGTPEHPGVNVAAKRALNRAIAEASMGETNQLICREAERLGIPILPAPAAGTSQTCPRCGHRDPQNR